MPVTPTYPGVYIEEIPSGVRTIVGVATSVAAFIDYFKRGPLDKAVQIFSMGDFEREFGGLDKQSEGGYAIQQFFLNEGTEAWVVRTARNTGGNLRVASAVIQNLPSATSVLRLRAGRSIKGAFAGDPGTWGNNLRADVDYNTSDPTTLFNLTVSEVSSENGREVVLRSETFRNLTLAAGPNNALSVVNDSSKMVQLSQDGGFGSARPAQTGTTGTALSLATARGIASGNTFRIDYTPPSGPVQRTATLTFTTPPANLQLQEIRGILESAIQAAGRAATPVEDPLLSGATVQLINNQFRILAGGAGQAPRPGIVLQLVDIHANAPLNKLGLVGAGVSSNVQQYSLGATPAGTVGAQVTVANDVGADGDLPTATELRGIRDPDKSGLYALEDVDIFNILCIPRASMLTGATDISAVIGEAEAYCLERRAFLIVDVPPIIDTIQEAKDWMDANATLRSRNAAVYFPRVKIADPLDNYRLRSFGASGTIAGLYARTDVARGVWKAPAGTEATLRNVQELDYKMSDRENGALNPLGINCLRTFSIYGNVCWGARTLDGSDQQASEWKYVPVRRIALFIEESLYRGTKWVVFEPNDEPLWSQIRLNVGAYMHSLFRQGAFQGQTPREAYLVKCDKETTTQDDINRGIVNIVVGFAPLKPAEFVIIKIQQLAGQIQT